MDLHETSFEYRRSLFMKKLHHKLANTNVIAASFVTDCASSNGMRSSGPTTASTHAALHTATSGHSPSYSLLFERRKSFRSMPLVNASSSKQNYSNDSSPTYNEVKVARHWRDPVTSSLLSSHVSSGSISGEKTEILPLKQRELNSKTPLESSLGSRPLSVIPEKKKVDFLSQLSALETEFPSWGKKHVFFLGREISLHLVMELDSHIIETIKNNRFLQKSIKIPEDPVFRTRY